MNIASIDIGTNTVLLLIVSADIKTGQFDTVTNQYNMPRLGRGLSPNSPIPQENISRFEKVIDEYDKLIKKYKCETILLKATNAMRIATNSDVIVTSIKNKYGYQIEIIKGEEEARLSFLGASSTLPDTNKKTVIDIGGGSTEVIFGTDAGLQFRKSFEMGAVSLTEKCVFNDPPAELEISEMRDKISKIFLEMNYNIFYHSPIIAVAGTPTTLSGMKQQIKFFDDKKIEKSIITNSDFDSLIKILSENDTGTIKKNYGRIVEGREDVLLAGTLILEFLMKKMKSDHVIVSSRGLRYGAVVDYLNQIRNNN